MNRCYRLVWSRALQVTQVASELASSTPTGAAKLGSTGAVRRPGGCRFLQAAGQAALALSLTSIASSVWAATCSATDMSACSAAGGSGVTGRSGNGGMGNGQGGGSSHLAVGGATVQDAGSLASLGDGGNGATGDSGSTATGGAVGFRSSSSNASVGLDISGTAGTTGPGGTNFGSGGSGGGAGIYFTGSNMSITTGATIGGGAGGAGGVVGNTVSGNGGGGGGGGAGLVAVGAGVSLDSAGSLIGGAGGVGGAGGFGGGGGGGGDGLVSLGGSASIINTGTITGGAGAAGGAGSSGSGTSGAGGTGVRLIGNNNTLVNTGTITGGGSGSDGTAGAGVVTAGFDVITNAGTISAGIANGTRAAAVEFGGIGNVLNLLTGSALLGNLAIDAGASATIAAQNSGLALSNAITLGNTASTVTFNTATAPLSLSGVISGSGSVTMSGGTLVSSATNTYSGTTTISSGMLMLSGSGSIAASAGLLDNGLFDISLTTAGTSVAALTGTGAVALGTRSLTLSSAAGTFSGAIGGSGGLTVAGGTQTLAGTNTYTGTTSIGSGATLALSGTGSIASSGSVANDGTLDISGTTSGASISGLTGSGTVALGARTLTLTNASGTYAGTIAGTGGLTLDSGVQTLTAASTYTGATTLNGGTLALSGAGSLPSTSSVSLAGSGATLDMSGAGAQSIAHLSGVAGSRVLLGANTLAVTAGTGDTFSGTLAGTGVFAKQGTGTLMLNGASSGFSGTTLVSGGTLEVGDASHTSALLGGNVTVDSQGTLRGHGTVSGNVANSGIVMPGGSIGTLTIGGDYTQASTARLTIEVSPTAGSQLQVGGAASLSGALSIVYGPGTYTARRYKLLSAANGVSGTFATIDTSTSSGTDLSSVKQSLLYGANEVDLQLVAANGGSGSIVVAPTDTSIYTAVGTAALMRAQTVNAALLGRPAAASAAASDGASAAPGAWVKATGSSTRMDGADSQPGFMAHEYGFLAGADRRVGAYTVGMAGGYSHTSIDEDTTGNAGATDTLRMALYGGRDFGAVRASATIGYALDFLSQKRPFGSVGTAEGDHFGHELSAAAQAALPMHIGTFVLLPSAGLRYAYFRGNGFGESGAGGQDLSVGPDNARSLQPYLSLALDKTFGDETKPVNLQLRLGYARELLGDGRSISVSSRDGTAFAAPGDALERDYLTSGASVSFHPSKATMVSLGFDALVDTGHASAQSGYARFDYRF